MQTDINKHKTIRTNKTRVAGQQQRNNNAKKSTLNPNLLIQQAVISSVKSITVETRFEDMALHVQLKTNIQKMGFVSPTEIQDKTFDKLVEGANLIGIANTGTGKTGAFLIPILENLLRNRDNKFQSLIIVPTRELALQVYDEFKKLSEGLKLRVACYIGGTNVEKDVRSLSNYFDLVIGTPGRLLDLRNRGLKTDRFEVLVLDEFDKMLDMGFIRDIRQIVGGMKQRKQTLLFSATKDPKQQTIISEIVSNPFIVEINSGDQSSKNVEQDIIKVQQGEDKFKLLMDLLNQNNDYNKVILFTETKHLANRLSKRLNESGVKSDQIHGNKSQNYRVNALDKFKNGSIRVLVATDVAARGIDVNNVSLVINYQVPKDFDTYIHRVGRTGRAGKTGTAYTFVD
jgi:ATP-dependent RNA helicase RhlE